jgi:hypothetical protein
MYTFRGKAEKMRYVDFGTSQQISINSPQRALNFEPIMLAVL